MELDMDAWRSIVDFLGAEDIVAVSSCCKIARLVCCEHQVWKNCCHTWWKAQHGAEAPEPEGWPGIAMSSLGLSSWPATYKALHIMGVDLVGSFWACTNKAPRGQLLLVQAADGKIMARNVQAEYNALDGTYRPDLTELVFTLRFSETPQSPRSFLGKEHTLPALKMAVTFLQGSSERPALLQGSAPNSFTLIPATEDASAAEASGRTRASSEREWASSRTSSSFLSKVLGRLFKQQKPPPQLLHEAASEHFERVFVSPPLPLQTNDSSAMESMKAVQHLPGLWCAPYGSHGLEVLQLFFSDSLPPEDVGGIQGLSVVGLKVLGDPNVPANKISFVASLEDPGLRLEGLLADGRVLVGFTPNGNQLLDLRVRDVDQVFPVRGQINRIPGEWHPEWEDADLVTYKDAPNSFSLIWRNYDEVWRHIMDFHRFASEAPGGWGVPYQARNPNCYLFGAAE